MSEGVRGAVVAHPLWETELVVPSELGAMTELDARSGRSDVCSRTQRVNISYRFSERYSGVDSEFGQISQQ